MSMTFWGALAVMFAVIGGLQYWLDWAVVSSRYSKYRLRTPGASYLGPQNKWLNVFLNNILALSILAAAWAVVTGSDIVHSVVWLATVFLLTAGIFILAGAEFLAVIQVLVYVGAVSVVILFGIMLTRRTLPGGDYD